MNDVEFDWYRIVAKDQSLQQGDFLDSVPIVQPEFNIVDLVAAREADIGEIDISAVTQFYNVVVMTQSCDLANATNEDMITLCARYDYSSARSKEGKSIYNPDGWGKLRRGQYTHLHILSNCDLDGHEFEYQIIDLQRTFNVPFGFIDRIRKKSGERICLNPPYREQLGQAFARQFMRVGLPLDLPRKFPGAS